MRLKSFLARLIAAWWTSTCSLLALAMDRRMTTGLAEEWVDCAEAFSRELFYFRCQASEHRSREFLRDSQ